MENEEGAKANKRQQSLGNYFWDHESFVNIKETITKDVSIYYFKDININEIC